MRVQATVRGKGRVNSRLGIAEPRFIALVNEMVYVQYLESSIDFLFGSIPPREPNCSVSNLASPRSQRVDTFIEKTDIPERNIQRVNEKGSPLERIGIY